MAGTDPWQDLLDEGRVREAGTARGRERWLRTAGAEDATLAGTLLDLAEAGAEVVLRTTAGGTHRGRVVLVGRDVVAVRPAPGPLVLVPFDAVVSVHREGARRGERGGARPAPAGPGLLDLLASLVDERAEVLLSGPGGASTRGRLVAVGADLVQLRTGEGAGATAYVSARSIGAAVVFRSG